jgi:hypothetical protein
MDIQSLIRLAHQADLEGNYRVADKLTERAIREAQFFKNIGNIGRNVGEFFGNMATGRGARDTMNSSLNINPTAAGGPGGAIQQGVAAVADAVNVSPAVAKAPAKIRMTAKNTTGATFMDPVHGPLPVTGNRARMNEIADQLSDEDKIKLKRANDQAAAFDKVRIKQQPTATATSAGEAEADAKALGMASAPGGAADSSVGGISKADRFKSHNTTGITGPAAIGLLGTGAAGMLGAQYLANRQGPGPAPVVPGPAPTPGPGPMPPVMPGMKGQDFKANQLAERSQANQMQDAQLAQNFIQVRKGLPNFTTAQDFYYAAQAAGMTPGQMNQVAALAKAEGFRDKTPMMN